jgi:hypothetical protein
MYTGLDIEDFDIEEDKNMFKGTKTEKEVVKSDKESLRDLIGNKI